MPLSKSPKNKGNGRCNTTLPKPSHKDSTHEEVDDRIAYIKADWIDKIIKIKEHIDK